MTDKEAAGSFAVQRRRAGLREEFAEQAKLAGMLAEYLPAGTFWTSLENKPLSRLSGRLQKLRGVRIGLPDTQVLFRRAGSTSVIFVELKSRRGVASKAEKKVRTELIAAGARWRLARTARAAMTALQRSGVVFAREWEPPPLEPWEGPFADPTRKLPQHPEVAAQRRAGQRAWRERRRARKAAKLAAERAAAAGVNVIA